MKKTIIALATLFLVALGANAIDYNYTLVVNMTDGSKVNYLFENTPVAMIEGDDLKITEASTQQTVTYPIADIENMTFDKTPDYSNVKNLSAEGEISFGLTRSLLEIFGLENQTEVKIYDSAAVLVASGSADANGYTVLNIENLGSGVFVVMAGQHSFKFIR